MMIMFAGLFCVDEAGTLFLDAEEPYRLSVEEMDGGSTGADGVWVGEGRGMILRI